MSILAPSARAPSPRVPSLLPREHGAYVQLLAPLLSSLLFVRPTLAAAGYALAACAAFIAHEPLWVVLGRRGARTEGLLKKRARVHLLLWSCAAALGFSVGVFDASAIELRALAVPLLFATATAWLVARDLEKELSGQLLLGTTLATFSLPVLVSSGVSFTSASAVTFSWALLHGLGTLAARGFVYRKRGGKVLLRWACAVALLSLCAGAALYASAVTPFGFWLALLPSSLVTVLLTTGTLCPRSPKQVGYALLAANLVAVALFGLGLRGLV